MGRGISNVRKLSLGGILAAMAVICVFLASILPTSRISFYVLSSFFVSVLIIESGIKNGWIFYFATSFLAFSVVSIKIRALPYIMFFGLYGIIKYYIEKLNNRIFEIVLKLIYFNLSLAAIYFITKELFLQDMEIKLQLWAIAVILQIVFIIYDYVYTLFIGYYNQKLKNILKI